MGVAESAYLVSIKEDHFHLSSSGSVFGVCFVDTCIGTFHVKSLTTVFVAITDMLFPPVVSIQ